MRTRKYQKYVIVALFSLSLLLMGIFSLKIVNRTYLYSSENNTGRRLTDAIRALDNEAVGKGILTEVYGITHKAMGLNIIGNFEYALDESGTMQMITDPYDSTGFSNSVISLQNKLAETGIPLVFMQLPDRGMHFSLSNAVEYFGKTNDEMIDTLKAANIDVLTMEKMILQYNPQILNDYFFKSDVHLTSKAGYYNSKLLVDYLSDKYGINFPEKDVIFNPENWDWYSHAFWGNLGQSSGRIFTGVDTFETFFPHETDCYRLTIPNTGVIKEGSFQDVLTNGYDEHADGLYWVTNYGQWPQALYIYENLSLSDGPDLLVLCDSVGMTGNVFLAVGASSLTVMDLRYFGDMPYLADYLAGNHYDAVIICASDSAFYCQSFLSTYEETHIPNDLPTIEALPVQGYGGMFIDLCNDTVVTQKGILPTAAFAETNNIVFDGWAADFMAMEPLSALYLQIGDRTIACRYGHPRESVASYFNDSRLLNTGFHVAFPKSWIEEQGVQEVTFFLVSSDGTFQYRPVAYTLSE